MSNPGEGERQSLNARSETRERRDRALSETGACFPPGIELVGHVLVTARVVPAGDMFRELPGAQPVGELCFAEVVDDGADDLDRERRKPRRWQAPSGGLRASSPLGSRRTR
jgi:hypothetical protein